ncbi:hypothetical protein [uncultured Salinisphaera sp.]|uniref:hypothetical protein n=1 Tax=uncultured Salinisphaera sp. TaxID=359372 RepID=UPI0032B27F8B|tara:strand:- start:30955 stop:31107 length:153 start_codon:yes stop_codon:yes gene_type:complete
MPRPTDPNDEKSRRERPQTDDKDRPTRGSQQEKDENGYREKDRDSNAPRV